MKFTATFWALAILLVFVSFIKTNYEIVNDPEVKKMAAEFKKAAMKQETYEPNSFRLAEIVARRNEYLEFKYKAISLGRWIGDPHAPAEITHFYAHRASFYALVFLTLIYLIYLHIKERREMR